MSPDDVWLARLGTAQTLEERDSARQWSRLRRAGAAHWAPATDGHPGFWVVPRHEDVRALMSDSRLTSRHGNMLSSLLEGGDPAGGRVLALMDPPGHAGLRRPLHQGLRGTFLDELPDRVERVVDGMLDEALQRGGDGPVDMAPLLSDRLPITVICDLLGVPESDRPWMLERSKQALSADEAGADPVVARVARVELVDSFVRLVRTPRPGPLLQVLLQAPGPDSDVEAAALNCYGLLLAGDETTRLTLNSALWLLARHPDVWSQVVRGEIDLAELTEEIMRVASPVAHVARVAREELAIGDACVAAGDVVSCWLVSANHDESTFPRPGALRRRSAGPRHLGFGHGAHYCLGAELARVQVHATLRVLRRRVRRVVPGDAPRAIYSSFLRGYSTMPVLLEPAGVAA